MRDHHALVDLEVFRKLQPDLMRCIKIQRIVRGEGLDDVIIATAICFAELFLYRFEFILSCLSHAVDTGYETLHRFLTVCNICRCVDFAKANCETLTYEQERQLDKLQEKLTDGYPSLEIEPPTFEQTAEPQQNM